MAPKSKSIFRQPGTQHFQLVHRSQRDPLIHDPDAPQHVLKPFTRDNNQRKGKSRADLESILSPSDLAARPNVGEASLYGIYYDDTEYDYMQHLRPVGVQEDGVESTLLSAPAPNRSKGKGKDRAHIDLKEEDEGFVPASALASKNEMPRNYEAGAAVPSALAGFQPDMDPHLRQALEALEDDAFVDDELADDDGDDFFGELVKDGERAENEEFEYEFDEYGLEVEEEDIPDDAPLEDRVAAFKRRQKASASAAPLSDGEEEGDFGSEGADTIGGLPTFSVIGGKKRRTGGSDASGYSMSSSAMARTESMRLLDDHFEVFEQRHYAEDADEDDDDDEYIPDDEDGDEAPDLIATREDFESMMDEFLDKFDVAGGKMKPVLEGDATAKLNQLRAAMGRDGRQKEDSESEEDDEEAIYAMLEKEDKGDRWDVESVLTTHTNLENHPRLIRARTSKPVPKITLDPRTGLPIVTAPPTKPKPRARAPSPPSSGTDTETEDHPRTQTIARSKDESKEDKKARKAAVKEHKAARRTEKKASKVAFGNAVRKEIGVVASHSIKTRKL